MKIAWACVLAGVLNVLAMPSIAEPGPIGRWLMGEPLSLWDKGMFEANEAARRAATFVGSHRGELAWGSASYNWNNNEIDLFFNVQGFRDDPTHEKCNELRRYFIGHVAAGAHFMHDEEQSRARVQHTIDEWFSHYGYRDKQRDEELAEKITRILFVRVNLWSKGGTVTCRDRILSSDAPSKPL